VGKGRKTTFKKGRGSNNEKPIVPHSKKLGTNSLGGGGKKRKDKNKGWGRDEHERHCLEEWVRGGHPKKLH